jgi:hypothetical protein
MGIWTAIGLTALNMDNAAHFGGLVAGGLATWVMIVRKKTWWIGFALAFVAALAGAARPWWTPHGRHGALLWYFTHAWLYGKVPELGGRHDDVPWTKDTARGLRLGERGCARDVAMCCLEIAAYYESIGDPRATELRAKTCALEPGLCASPPQ